MAETDRVIIVGASHGGVAAALELRKQGYDGEIVLLGDEAAWPYERPPLSKAWLLTDDPKKAPLAADDAFTSRDIVFRRQIMCTHIDPAAKTVSLHQGETLPYRHLILATGSRARQLPLPGATAAGVHSLRTAADADQLRAALGAGGSVAIIGAGYIGLEVAASARHLGLNVTIIEQATRCMARTASPELSAFYEAYHRAKGVAFFFGTGVTEIQTADDRATGVQLSTGDVIPADHVLVAAGGVPNDELAQGAGLACDNGILVDEDARTADPAIFAIGDVARRPSAFAKGPVRLESVHNAHEQAKLAAASICGKNRARIDAPWFWSDQYDLKLQIAGLIQGGEDRVVRTENAENAMAVFHYQGDQLTAVEGVNAPLAYMASRKALTMGQTVDRAMAGDPDADLRQAIRPTRS